MRHFLTGLGILICLALIVAMGAPHFIEWGNRRALFEKRIQQMTGLPARIDGAIAVTLLPTPTLSLDQVKLGKPDGAGFHPIEVERLSGALAATALLRGEFIITEALIDGPLVRMGPQGLEWPEKPELQSSRRADPEAISIEKLQIRDGHVELSRPGRTALTITSLSADLEANSLLGPARGNGSMVLDGARRSIRFALGKVESGRSRVKVLMEDHGLLLRLDVDGTARLDGGAPSFEGTASLTGNPGLDADSRVQLPLRSTSKVAYAAGRIAFDDISMTLGGEPQPLTLSGAGSISLVGSPRVDLTLSGRSFDFDRPGPDGKPKAAVPADLIRQVQALAATSGPGGGLPDGRLDLSVGGLIIGGQTVIGARVVVEQSGARTIIHRFEGELPGQTRVNFARDALSDQGLVSGVLQFESRDPERLNGWFYGVPRVITAQAGLKASAVLSSIRDGISVDRIEIDRGATHLSGEGAYLLSLAGVRPAPRLTMALQSPRLDIGDIPAFAYGGERHEEKPDLDFDIAIDAQKLVLDGKETGRLTLKARRDGEITSIERLEISELDGANLIASGTLGGGARRLTIKLDAAKMDGITAIGEQLLPGAFMRSLRKRASLMSPALLVASLSNDDSNESYAISADGRLADTVVKVGGSFVGKNDIAIDLNAAFQNRDGAMLARQIGAGSREVHSPLPGAITLAMRGNLRGALDVDLDLALAGLSSKIDGQIRIFQAFSPFEGTIVAESSDLGPLSTALEVDPAFALQGVPLRLNGRVQSNLDQITVSDLKASLGGWPIQGEVAVRISENGKIAGQLRVPSVDLRAMSALALGQGAPMLASGRWSPDPFGKPVSPPLRGDLWVEAGRARLDDALEFDNAKFVFRFDERAVSVEYGEFRSGPARVTGDVLLRRSTSGAQLTGRLKWSGADVTRIWSQGLKGTTDGELQLNGAGESAAKVAQSLSGAGFVTLRNVHVPALDPEGLKRVLGSLPATSSLDSATLLRRLESELQRAPLTAAELRSPLVIVDGVARLAPVAFSREAARGEASGTIDFGKLSLDMRLTSTALQAPADWRGAPPQYTVQWLGALNAPRRSLSVDSLLNGFLATGLQKDSEALDLQQQDVRERGMFNRRLRASQQERQRAEEAARAEALRQQSQQLRDLIEQTAPTGGASPLNLLPDPAYPPAR